MVANADSVALVEWVRIASERKPQQTEFSSSELAKAKEP
jgi:hypothetical protein